VTGSVHIGSSDPWAGPGTPLRVLIADDDDLMRAGLRAVLGTDDTIEVVAEAGTGPAAVEQAQRLRPDVVLMDVRMPDLDGIAATRQLVARVPSTRVLVLTTFEDDEYIFGALRAGASGFLLKRTRPEQLIQAIHTIAGGEALLSPSVTRTVINRMAQQAQPDQGSRTRLLDLTPRERDVLELVARGLSNREIAGTLVVEESTVKSHLKRILAKLHLRDRIGAVILGYETGLVRPGEQPPSRG
jgi:DNA-binding NarL/FixJ family response regulator